MLIDIVLINGSMIQIACDRYMDYGDDVVVYFEEEVIGTFRKNNIAGFYVESFDEEEDE